MSNLVIVALPAEDDYIHQISSQKVPHFTLLFLGEVDKVKNLTKILDFVEHAAERSLCRFGMEVDRRGELGEDNADVLFFSKRKWSGYEAVKEYRSFLLKNDNIRMAYDGVKDQYPEFIPHLTLGYPDSPAKPDTRDYPGTSYVNFDRIAVWVEEFDGPEFPLKIYEWDAEVAMSNVSLSEDVDEVVEDILQHFGKKGMKWGVRNRRTIGPQAVTVRDKGKRLKSTGGRGHPGHSDAIGARVIGRKGQKSGFKSLSNQELTDYAKRLNLEQNAKRLNYGDKSPPKRFILKLLGQTGNQVASETTKTYASTKVKSLLKVAAVAA